MARKLTDDFLFPDPNILLLVPKLLNGGYLYIICETDCRHFNYKTKILYGLRLITDDQPLKIAMLNIYTFSLNLQKQKSIFLDRRKISLLDAY